MLIDNPDVFKTWLTSILEPLCDADPAALAKYVYALVKKDKPLDDLREGMLDQLDVFLQQETKPFVDMLFKSLETQEYLKGVETNDISPIEESVKETPAVENNVEEPVIEQETNGLPPHEERPVSPLPARNRVVLNRPPPNSLPHTEQTLVKVVPTQLLEEPIDLPRRRDRRELLREKEDRRRRRSRSWDRNSRRPRRHPWRDTSPNANNDTRRNDRRRAASRSPSPNVRGRYRNRSPPQPLLERPLSRSRSRSPALLREHERDRLRIPRELERDRMSRDRMSRDRDHRDRLSRSRDRDRSRSPGTPIRDTHHDKHLNNNFMTRCRDFDEKGYCMRGDLCQWDHGKDPVVLEDPCRVLLPPAVPEYNPLAPNIYPQTFPQYLPPRELVPIPRVRELPPQPIVLPHTIQPVVPHINFNTNNKKNFDYNRLGNVPRPPLGPNAVNCSLEVKKVPRGMNDITHLNNHFGKFGKIVNIQVGFEGDPEAALITFSNHTEANVAYKSTEAVLNNRFIKVFWHNPESKQENVPPSNGNAFKSTEKPSTQHPASHNKVLINKDNMKATADNKANDEKLKEEVRKEAVTKTVNDKKSLSALHKRAQGLLETQLQQQRLLIGRLESEDLTEAQKKELMTAIRSSQEAIEKLRKELLAYNNKALQAVQGENVASYMMSRLQLSQARKPKTEAEAEKAILDAEMDIHNKQQEGQDVTELLKKLAELKRQKALQFPSHPVVRRPHPRNMRYPNNTRYVRNSTSTSKVFVNQSVDHRPRALLISGFEDDEIDAVVKHFSQFGEIIGKEVNTAVPELILQFRVRAHAELAVTRAKHYNDRTLSINWITNNKPITPVSIPMSNASTSAETPDETSAGETKPAMVNGDHSNTETAKKEETEQVTAEPIEDPLLRFDEEEEEETEEDRSWRR